MQDCPTIDYGAYLCYELSCDPERSLMLAYNHFSQLEAMAEAQTLAAITAASLGKPVPAIKQYQEDHWGLTLWGAQYLELKGRFRHAAYGSRFRK